MLLYAGYSLGNGFLAAFGWMFFLFFQGIFLFSKLCFALGTMLMRIVHSFVDGIDSIYDLLAKICSKICRLFAVVCFLVLCVVASHPRGALSIATGTELQALDGMTLDVVFLELLVLFAKSMTSVLITLLVVFLRAGLRYVIMLPGRIGSAIATILFDDEAGQSFVSIAVQYGVRQFFGSFLGGSHQFWES